MAQVTIKFGESEVIVIDTDFETNTEIVSSTLEDYASSHWNASKTNLVHAIICQHANYGVDVSTHAYAKGLEMALTWHCFHEGR
jgi:hypothetical protein